MTMARTEGMKISARAEDSALEESRPTPPKAAPFNAETYLRSGLRESLEQNSRKTIFAKEIVAKGGIADLATQLRPDEGDNEDRVLEGTRLALLHLEAEQYALAELRESGDIESGLEKCKKAWNNRKRKPLPYSYKTNAEGKRLPVPFEEGLKVLMPRDAKERRTPYFLRWLVDDCIDQLSAEIAALEKQADDESLNFHEHANAFALMVIKQQQVAGLQKNSRQLIKAAERKIREMQRRGIEPRLFERAQLRFRDWKTEEVSKKRKAAATQGAKRRRKRVARPPVAAMKKILVSLKEGKVGA
jgi:hypothetical protein